MHEFSVTKALVDLCNQEADKNDIKNVRRINVKVGKFTGFSPDSILFYFEHLKINTKLREACIFFEEIPIRIKCSNCRKEYTIEEPVLVCPSCGGGKIDLVSGREFYVSSIEGE